MDTVTDLYRFAQLARITISEACQQPGCPTNRTVSRWHTQNLEPNPHKFIAVRDALIELAHDRCTLPVNDVDQARRMGLKKLIGRMKK